MKKEALIILGVIVAAIIGLYYFVKKKFPAVTPPTTTTSSITTATDSAAAIAGGQEGSIPSSSLGGWVYPDFAAVDADPNLTTAQKNSCKAAMQVEIDIRNAHPEWNDKQVETERARLRNIEITQSILANPVNLSPTQIRMYEAALAFYQSQTIGATSTLAARIPTSTSDVRLTSTEKGQIAAIKKAVASGDRVTGAKLLYDYYKAHGGV